MNKIMNNTWGDWMYANAGTEVKGYQKWGTTLGNLGGLVTSIGDTFTKKTDQTGTLDTEALEAARIEEEKKAKQKRTINTIVGIVIVVVFIVVLILVFKGKKHDKTA